MNINIKSITIRIVDLPLVAPFTTSFGTQIKKECILVEMKNSEGISGWSEIPVTSDPGYTYETIKTAWHILEDFLIPDLVKRQKIEFFDTYNNFYDGFQKFRGHNITKAGLEMAYWVLKAEQDNKLLNEVLGINHRKIASGVSIGIQKDFDSLLKRIFFFLDQKYKRIKIKIEPGWDLDIVKQLRQELGYEVDIMVDANSAYTLNDIKHLKKLDEYKLMMIEQPLGYTDIIDHIQLQKEMKTPICLDESIHSFADAKKGLNSGACKIINIKVARVGGLAESIKIADYIIEQPEWKAWCGGMLETGIGRMINIYLQMHSGFNLPGDTSGSDRYFKRDIIDPVVKVENGYITPSKNGSGLGVEIDTDFIDSITRSKKQFLF